MMSSKTPRATRSSLQRLLPPILVLATALTSGPVFGFNNDALPDLVFANQVLVRNRVCLQDGLLGLVCADVSTNGRQDFGVAVGDMNEDGNLDAVFKTTGAPNRLCFGDGMGGFTECQDVSPDADGNFLGSVVLGDINGDSHLDAVFANNGDPNRVCLGNGRGRLDDCSDVSPEANRSRGLALGDLNNDGEPDLVFANTSNQLDRVCLGDGSGEFSCSNVSGTPGFGTGVALGDLNGDGDLDAVFANSSQQNQVCLGDGTGSFSCNVTNMDQYRTEAVALGDLNGDGDLDAIFANDADQPNRVCLGDGFGFLTNCSDATSGGNSTDVALEDLDADGDLDAVFTQTFQPNLVCLGDGTGSLNCSNLSESGDPTPSTAVAISRLGPFCSSPVRDLVDLEREVARLATSAHTIKTLDDRLGKIQNWLDKGQLDKAREHVDDFITQAIKVADPNTTQEKNRISRAESDSLVCGSSNLLDNLPGDE